MDKHTPGKWEIEGSAEIYPLILVDGKAGPIAQVFNALDDLEGNEPITLKECEANAHLISAAPDLLAYAEKVQRWFRDGCPPWDMKDGAAAIAKAKGE